MSKQHRRFPRDDDRDPYPRSRADRKTRRGRRNKGQATHPPHFTPSDDEDLDSLLLDDDFDGDFAENSDDDDDFFDSDDVADLDDDTDR